MIKEVAFMEELLSPRFEVPLTRSILRYPHKEPCQLRSLDRSFKAKEHDLDTIVRICNEPLIYHNLFQKKHNGRPYNKVDAERFFLWSRDGWNRGEWFVFLIRDAAKNVVGAIDIKSNRLEGAEIGYWASSATPGVMTNAVNELCSIAKKAGYKSLFALIQPDNQKSVGVISRAHFAKEGQQKRDGLSYLQFSRTL